MPNWKKVITSGSTAELSNVVVSDGGAVGATNDKWIFDETNDRIYNFNANTKIIGNGTGTSGINTYDDFMQGGSIASICNNLNGTEPMFLAVNTRDATGAHVYSQFRTGHNDRLFNVGIHASSGDFFISSGSVSRTHFIMQHNTNNIGIGTDAPTTKLQVEGNISASGDLDIDGNAQVNQITASAFQFVGSGVAELEVQGNITASGNISASEATLGTTLTTTNKFEKTGNTDAEHQGDVVFLGGTTSMDAGKIYHYKSDGTWELADADAASTSDGLLAVALGAASDTNGMLLRGTVTLDHDPGAVGDVLFLSTTAGQATATAPSGNTDIVRVVGYCLDASNGQIWFNPSSTFVEVSA